MANEISLFSGYNQKENRTTNYCLLILKMLYEENPKFLGEVLRDLIDEQLANLVGVKFQQQTKKKRGTPDGLILQKAFTLYIETKNYDWFYDDQLERHLEDLHAEGPGTKILLAIGQFESLDEKRFERIQDLCAEKYEGSILFAAVTFELFLGSLPKEKVSKNMADLISDFEAYLDDQWLLPRWEYRLDVVNCSRRPREILEGNVYICPATGGAYNHKRSKYFGLYRQKQVGQVALIEAVIDLESAEVDRIRWKNVERDDKELIDVARAKHVIWRKDAFPSRVFLLGNLASTNYKKSTKGGMFTSKRYFNVEDLEPKDVVDLAEKLRDKTWKA